MSAVFNTLPNNKILDWSKSKKIHRRGNKCNLKTNLEIPLWD